MSVENQREAWEELQDYMEDLESELDDAYSDYQSRVNDLVSSARDLVYQVRDAGDATEVAENLLTEISSELDEVECTLDYPYFNISTFNVDEIKGLLESEKAAIVIAYNTNSSIDFYDLLREFMLNNDETGELVRCWGTDVVKTTPETFAIFKVAFEAIEKLNG